jgi:DNA polymerase alpha subunit B
MLCNLIFCSLLNSIQEEQVVVGRICSEEDAKLKDTTIILETSRLMGAGARVPLKFNSEISMNGNKTIYPIFPGEIVGLKGRNETGDWFQVSEILPVCVREPVWPIFD